MQTKVTHNISILWFAQKCTTFITHWWVFDLITHLLLEVGKYIGVALHKKTHNQPLDFANYLLCLCTLLRRHHRIMNSVNSTNNLLEYIIGIIGHIVLIVQYICEVCYCVFVPTERITCNTWTRIICTALLVQKERKECWYCLSFRACGPRCRQNSGD